MNKERKNERPKNRYSSDNHPYRRSTRNDIYDDGFSNKSNYVDIYSSGRRKTPGVSVKKVVLSIFFVILGLIGSAMIYAYNMLHSFNYQEFEDDSSEILTDDFGDSLINDSQILNIMLIGSDSMSTGDHGRSDSLMILSLDIKNHKIKITSLMRDIWINIPGHGYDRLNAAYAFGGAKLTIETIEKTFGLHVDRYAIVDFEGFSNIIDTLGGIDLELTSDECIYINTYSGDKNTLKGNGLKHLTGLQALHHSRNRNSKGSDYDRTSRQRNVIRAIVDKLKNANLKQITELIPTIAPLITTNFKTSEISRLATNSLTYLKYDLEEFRLPTNDNVQNETISQKMVLVIPNIAKARYDFLKFIYESEDIANNALNSALKNSNSQKNVQGASDTKKSASSKQSAKNYATNKSENTKAKSSESSSSKNRSYQSTKSQTSGTPVKSAESSNTKNSSSTPTSLGSKNESTTKK
ncbi:MAG: LCP family protein [Acutalibacteraceae bacterium]